MIRSLLGLALTLTSGLAFCAQTPQCPDFGFENRLPAFDYPQEEGFRYFWNNYLSRDQEYHMVHDGLVVQGEESEVVMKFDYGGVFHKDLEFEDVQVYLSGTQMNEWQALGRYRTNSDGKIYVRVPGLAEGQYQLKAVVMGDLSEATGYLTAVRSGTQAVLFDIDGTLTQSDFEQLLDYPGIAYADPKPGAFDLVQSYMDKGYQVIYLTARVYWYARGTREWLDYMGLPQGFLRTSLSNEISLFKTADYKASFIDSVQAKGVEVVRAYGNATTDAEAYELAGLAKQDSFTIGKDAGHLGTQAIANDSYYEHLEEQVYTFPWAECQ